MICFPDLKMARRDIAVDVTHLDLADDLAPEPLGAGDPAPTAHDRTDEGEPT